MTSILAPSYTPSRTLGAGFGPASSFFVLFPPSALDMSLPPNWPALNLCAAFIGYDYGKISLGSQRNGELWRILRAIWRFIWRKDEKMNPKSNWISYSKNKKRFATFSVCALRSNQKEAAICHGHEETNSLPKIRPGERRVDDFMLLNWGGKDCFPPPLGGYTLLLLLSFSELFLFYPFFFLSCLSVRG